MDTLLRVIFRLTGSRHVSEMISERRVERRWREVTARHMANGGVVATYESATGSQSFLLGGADR